MNYGQGIGFNSNNTPGALASGAAENGLSVSATGKAVLGQDTASATDPAALLSDRLIPLKNFILSFFGNSIEVDIDDTSNFFIVTSILTGFQRVFELALSARTYKMGDISESHNGFKIIIDDGAQSWLIGSDQSVVSVLVCDPVLTGQELIFFDQHGARRMQFGIVGEINPSLQTRLINSSSSAMLKLEEPVAGGRSILGNDPLAVTPVFVMVDPASQRTDISGTNGLRTLNDTVLLHTATALANGAGASAGTLNNAPAAGNPTKWIKIDDNGTIRHIPAW
jgi:hypothetical protein